MLRKNSFLIVFIFLTACAATHKNPTSGPVASLSFLKAFDTNEGKKTLFGTHRATTPYMFYTDIGSDKCLKEEYKRVPFEMVRDRKTIKLPANKYVALSATFDYGSATCEVTQAFKLIENRKYSLLPMTVPGGCSFILSLDGKKVSGKRIKQGWVKSCIAE